MRAGVPDARPGRARLQVPPHPTPPLPSGLPSAPCRRPQEGGQGRLPGPGALSAGTHPSAGGDLRSELSRCGVAATQGSERLGHSVGLG